jgi:bifunctional UDP-N-acetylglucosamine pyrophosphorylase/glucosamine-1-phosphate N-acetyltransferase
MSWAAVILAAGKGMRMKSSTPKVLHRLAGREMIHYVIDATKQAQPKRLVLVVSHESRRVRELLGDSAEYVEQEEQLGTAHALLQARGKLEGQIDNVLVLNGDVPLISGETLKEIMRHHSATHAAVTILTSRSGDQEGLGRVIRDDSGQVTGIIEEVEADSVQKEIVETNSGVYCFRSEWLWPHLAELPRSKSGEFYLTDLIGLAASSGERAESVTAQDPVEALGINNRIHLAQAEAVLRQRIREQLMLNGVTLIDPPSVFIDATVEIAQDTVIYPNTIIEGMTRIDRECVIGPSSIIVDSVIGKGCRILASVIEASTLEDGVDVGPFSHLRPESYIEAGVHIGNFVEIKKSRLGRETKVGHFSYLGDATIGRNVNIGAGTITCNYDGVQKHPTFVGDDAFIGSDSMLIAPLRIGARATTGAGSVVNHDVPPDTLAVGAPARIRTKRRKED